MKTKKRVRCLAVFYVCFFFFTACKKEVELDPRLADPIKNIPELSRWIELEKRHNMDSCTLNQYFYRNENYFVLSNGSPILKYHFVNNSQIFNLEGIDIAQLWLPELYTIFFEEAKFVKKIWSKKRTAESSLGNTCTNNLPLATQEWYLRLTSFMDKTAWKSIIYQYRYKESTMYYGVLTPIEQKNSKNAIWAAMDCQGKNMQTEPNANWSQADFLAKAVLEKQLR